MPKVRRKNRAEACAHMPELGARPMMTEVQAENLEKVFKTLANATRLRMLHALERESELHVSELSSRLGMKPQAVSNQLQRLADRGIVQARRDGNRIHYRVSNPCAIGLLDLGWCFAEDETDCGS